MKDHRYEYTRVIRKKGVRRAVIRVKSRSYIKYLFHRLKAASAARKGRSYEYDGISGLRTYGKR